MWLFIDKLLRYVISFIVGIWLARYLGVTQFGLFNEAIAFVALFGTIASIGLRRITVRELVIRPDEQDQILGSAFTLLLVSGIIFWLICTAIAYFFYADNVIVFYLICAISLSFTFRAFESINYFFEAEVKLKYVVYATNTAYILGNLIKIVLILSSANLFAFAILYTIDIGLSALSLFVVFNTKGRSIFNWKYSKRIALQLLHDGAPLIFAGLMITLNSRVDQIMIGKMLSAKEVGWYAAAVKLTELWFFIPNIIRTSIFPNIVQSHANNQQVFYEKLEQILHLFCVFAYLVIIPVVLFNEQIIQWTYGEDFRNSSKALSILIILVLFIGIDIVKNSYLIIHNWTRLKLVFSIIAASINVIANLILIPKYGMIGACYASLLSYGISAYFATWFFPELRELSRIMTRALFLTRIRKIFS